MTCLALTSRRPYVAQGAAQAVEDAAALGVLLSTISSRDEIPLALKAYEQSRKPRADTVQQSGSENRITLHLPDGPEQRARDEQFRSSLKSGSNPDRWTDLETQKFLWGWDAEKAALDAWKGKLPSSSTSYLPLARYANKSQNSMATTCPNCGTTCDLRPAICRMHIQTRSFFNMIGID